MWTSCLLWVSLFGPPVYLTRSQQQDLPQYQLKFATSQTILSQVLTADSKHKIKSKSPAKFLRSIKRLTKFLEKKWPQNEHSILSLSTELECQIKTNQAKLTTSVPTLKSYTHPCIVCKENQCQMDRQHQFLYSVSEMFDQVLDRRFPPEKKPPDDI